MNHHSKLAIIGVLLASILGAVLFITITNSTVTKPDTTVTNTVSSSQSIRTELELKDLIKTSVTSISESIRTKDLIMFEKFVDKTAVCSSVFDSLYASLKSFLGDAIKKADILKKCTKDISSYVTESSKRTQSSSAGTIFISLEQLFSEEATTVLTQSEGIINTKLDYGGKSIVLSFRDVGDVAKLTGFQVETVAQKP